MTADDTSLLPGEKRVRAAALPPSERRAEIIATTLPLLMEHGSAMTTRQIAEAAGIAEGTIFRVFEDKTALIEAVVEQSGYLRELRASADPQDETRIENLAELVEVAPEFDEERIETGEVVSLEDFLERVSLVADADDIPSGAPGADGGDRRYGRNRRPRGTAPARPFALPRRCRGRCCR